MDNAEKKEAEPVQEEVSVRSQQEAVQEKLAATAHQAVDFAAAGGKAAKDAAMSTWHGAQTTAERLVLVGGALGIVSFFLPWSSVPVIGTRSGFSFAQVQTSIWFYPVMMAVSLFLTWKNLGSSQSEKASSSKWLIAMGAAWSWYWIAIIIGSSGGVGFGGFLAAIAAFLILAGGLMQAA